MKRVLPRAGALRLTVVGGPGTGQSVGLVARELVIGRDPSCGLAIDDRGVSREHAKLIRADAELVNIVDLRSRNGTWLNGERITAALLHPGDQLQLGPDTLVVFSIEHGGPVRVDPSGRRQEIERTLTTRELEVAIAVARGWTNLKVARALAVSVRTVESHLDHVYNKLDVDSRSELTALLHRVGLADPR